MESNETKQLIIIGLLGLVIVGTALGIRAGVFEGAPVMAVVSDSMSPTINKGDLIIYKTVECGSVVEGEVVIYQNPVGLTPFAHRVTEIVGDSKNRFFITKGDGSPHSDQDLGISPPILCEWIRGKMAYRIPKLGVFKVGIIRINSIIR
jgi:signal peptidase I